MVKKKIQDMMNAQIKHELESAYLYLSMAAYFQADGYEGMAHWMEKQAAEEVSHALKFYNHINEREGRVELHALVQPKKEWTSPLNAFKEAYQQRT